MNKFTRKYMKMARILAEDNDACFSRKIGVVLVDKYNGVIATGYNGAISKTPHPDTKEYLSHLWYDLLNEDDQKLLKIKYNVTDANQFMDKFSCQKMCPRKLLDIPSGQRLELCSCSHAERNALLSCNRSGTSTVGATIYCACGVCCHECTIAICQAKLAKVVCFKTGLPDY